MRKALVEVKRKLLDCLKQDFIGLAQDVHFFQLFQLGFWKIATVLEHRAWSLLGLTQ